MHGDEKPDSSMLFALLPTGGCQRLTACKTLRALRAQIDRALSSLHKSRAKLARAGAPCLHGRGAVEAKVATWSNFSYTASIVSDIQTGDDRAL